MRLTLQYYYLIPSFSVFGKEDQMKEDEPILITVEEAAKLMGVGKNLMLDLVKIDIFPSVKLVKRAIKVNKRQFIEWVNSLTSAF